MHKCERISKSDKVMPAWLPPTINYQKHWSLMPFSRVLGQSRGVVVSQWTRTMPHWSHPLISCSFISIAVHTADMYSWSNMCTLPSARIEVCVWSTNPTHNQLFLMGLRGISDCTKATLGSINHRWSNLRRIGVGWPLDGCAAVSAHMQMLLYTGGFGSREVLRQLRWWLGLLWSQPVWSKKRFVKEAGDYYVLGWGLCQWKGCCWTFATVSLFL